MSDAQASREAALAMVEASDGLDYHHPDRRTQQMVYLAEAQVHATLACAAATAEAGPQHETICPSCGTHIRARMADADGTRMLHEGDVQTAAHVLHQEMANLMPPGSYNWQRFAHIVLQSTGLLQ